MAYGIENLLMNTIFNIAKIVSRVTPVEIFSKFPEELIAEKGDLDISITPYDTNTTWIQDYSFYSVRKLQTDGTYKTVRVFGDRDGLPAGDAKSFTPSAEDINLPLAIQWGNFRTDGQGTAFVTTQILEHNKFYNKEMLRSVFRKFMGITNLIFLEPLKGQGAPHVDIFMDIKDGKVLLGQYNKKEHMNVSRDPAASEVLNQNRKILEELKDRFTNPNHPDYITQENGKPYELVLIPMPAIETRNQFIPLTKTYINYIFVKNTEKSLLIAPWYNWTNGIPIEDYNLVKPSQIEQILKDFTGADDVVFVDANTFATDGGCLHCISRVELDVDEPTPASVQPS